MSSRTDPKIDELIRPPRKIFVGFDWSRTDKLKPTGDVISDKVLGERLAGPSRRDDENGLV